MAPTNVVPFSFEGNRVRVTQINGTVWFVYSDVCTVLGLARRDSRTLREDEKGAYPIRTPGGTQTVTVISKQGLWRLAFRSDKPEAKRFTDFVLYEILPRFEGYQPVSAIEQMFEPFRAEQRQLHADLLEVRDNVHILVGKNRAPFPQTTKNLVAQATLASGGKCPNCNKNTVVNKHGDPLKNANFDHPNGPNDHSPTNCWLICIPCHTKFAKQGNYRNSRRACFETFQIRLEEFRRDGSQMLWLPVPNNIDPDTPLPEPKPAFRPPPQPFEQTPLGSPKAKAIPPKFYKPTRNMSTNQRQRAAGNADTRIHDLLDLIKTKDTKP